MVTTTQQRHGLHFEQDTVAARLIINYQRGIGRVKTCGQVPVAQHNHLLNHVKENIKMDYNSIPFRNNVIDRLQKREDKLVAKGYKAIDEGREKKADRILGRAARVEDRKIRIAEKK